jgi:glycine betaine/proline transport system substrate-binding protein
VKISRSNVGRILLVSVLAAAAVACGDDEQEPAAGAPTEETAAAEESTEVPAEEPTASAEAGAGIVLAVNPWTGSAVNAAVAKVVLEANLNTAVTLLDIDEYATWPGMEDGSIDAVLEVWPSGHAPDFETYIDTNKTVVSLGDLGPTAKIGWYVPTAVVTEHPELATWEGFKDPALAGLFATAETGDVGQFLMGDPTYVTFDEQIIANLGLPLQYLVGGSEAALLTAIDNATAEAPILIQFWKPHWKHLEADLTEVALPAVTDECLASAAAADGGYACDYSPDVLMKAASAALQSKNAAAFDFLSAFKLTTEQQSEIAGYVDRDGMTAADAAAKWVADNPDVVATWLG